MSFPFLPGIENSSGSGFFNDLSILLGPWVNAGLGIPLWNITRGAVNEWTPFALVYIFLRPWFWLSPLGFAAELISPLAGFVSRVFPPIYSAHSDLIYNSIFFLSYVWGVSVSTSTSLEQVVSRSILPFKLSLTLAKSVSTCIDCTKDAVERGFNYAGKFTKSIVRLVKSVWHVGKDLIDFFNGHSGIPT